jgi:hypothetical protein
MLLVASNCNQSFQWDVPDFLDTGSDFTIKISAEYILFY